MKNSLCLLLCLAQLSLLPTARAASVLNFAANIQNEELAEEAVTLLHCLADRSGTHWEFTGAATGDHWLKLEENQNRIVGSYFHEKTKTAVDLKVGEAEQTCAKFHPTEMPVIQPLAATEPTPDANFPAALESPPKNYWPWAIAFGAAALAGFIFWKANQHDHSALRMN